VRKTTVITGLPSLADNPAFMALSEGATSITAVILARDAPFIADLYLARKRMSVDELSRRRNRSTSKHRGLTTSRREEGGDRRCAPFYGETLRALCVSRIRRNAKPR